MQRFMPIKFRRRCAAVVLAVCSNLGLAHSATPLDEISVIGTRSELPLGDAAANVSTIGAEQLQLTGANHIQQLVNQVPGVSYQRGNGQESLPAIRSAVLTGAGACGNILVLEDAIPVRGAGFCNVNELFDSHFEQAGRIEIVRGAGTAFYGSNSLLGSINVHLPIASANSASIEFGPHSYRRLGGSWGYSAGDQVQGRVFATLTDDAGYRDESGYDQQKVSWRHAAKLNDWSLYLGATGTALDQQTAGFIVGDGAYLDAALSRENLDPEAFRDTESVRIWARVERAFGKQSFSLTPYFRKTKMDFLQHFLPGDPLEQNQQQGFGVQSSLALQATPDFTWTVGVDGELATGELLQSQQEATRGSAFLQATIPVGRHYDYKVKATQLAAFTHFGWTVAEKWRLLGGLRLESMKYKYDNRMLAGRTREDGSACGFGGCRYSRPADRTDSFSHLSPKIELRYQAHENLRWTLSVADSFRPPQATELYRLQRAQTVANLDEVQATHLELGLRWTSERSKLALNAYQIKQSNVIIRDSDFFNIDGQTIRSKGLEAHWQQQFNDRWATTIAASVADHEYGSAQIIGDANIKGNQVDTAPQLVGSANLSWQASERLSLQAQLEHVGDYFLEPNNRFKYPGHTLLNLRGSYQLSAVLSAKIRLLNLLDKRYASRADYTAFTEQRYFPGEPRSVYGELRWGF